MGSGCGASASSLTYDANGNVATRKDFNGKLTSYSYDLTRNLETQRKEGLNGDASVPTRIPYGIYAMARLLAATDQGRRTQEGDDLGSQRRR